MATSRDRGTAKQRVDQGYGVVCDPAGQPVADLIVTDTNQEHGIVTRRDGAPEADVRERLTSLGAEAMPMSTAEFDRFMRAEMEDAAKVVKAAGIKVQ